MHIVEELEQVRYFYSSLHRPGKNTRFLNILLGFRVFSQTDQTKEIDFQ